MVTLIKRIKKKKSDWKILKVMSFLINLHARILKTVDKVRMSKNNRNNCINRVISTKNILTSKIMNHLLHCLYQGNIKFNKKYLY